jgi:hypothetical protein
MNKILIPACILVSCLCQNVFAQDPDSGWWWNANESGRGYAIEKQGNTLFFASFLYDDSGFPSWYTATLNKNSQQNFSGVLQQYEGGQTLFGDYQQPVIVDANAGEITLDFSDSNNGTIAWPGGTVAISRFMFSEDNDAGNNNQSDDQKPEKGWWWNTDESGRGFAIEQQGNTIFFAAFLYDDSSSPTWYTAILDKNSQQEFIGNLQQYQGGQTLLGGYQQSAVLNDDAGEIKLVFSDSSHSTMTWPGGTVTLSRFIFASNDDGDNSNSDDGRNGSNNDDQNGSNDDRNGSNNDDRNGSNDDRNGSNNDDRNGSDDNRSGSDNDGRNGSDDDRNGSDNDDRNGSDDDRNGADNDDHNGSDDARNGSDDDARNDRQNR